ncbi:MAG TPA: amidohydrolase family protein [Bacteroidia bacterium]|jgi:imidazolonepropionase-like amidohydrolase|nr:amidohydrolase family protein [Bacteroidia bacterium]
MKKILFVPAMLTSAFLAGQTVTFPSNGAVDNRHTIFAFQHAHIQVDADNMLDNATMIVQDGMITDIGTAVTIPKGAVIYDVKGKSIYPSFIDPYTTYGMPEVKKKAWSMGPNMDADRTGAFGWNDALKADADASAVFTSDAKTAEDYRDLGFGTVMSYSADGIARGSSVCVTLNAEDGDNQVIVKEKAAACYSFDKGSSRQDYPSSLMGAIALMRQTNSDADWYRTAKNKTEYNLTLEAWNNLKGLPQIFETTDKWNVLRADKFGDEFNIQYIFKGSGNEYQRIDLIKATGGSFILPLNFPAVYDVEDPYDAELIDYATLKHWEMAPLNPSAFEKNKIPFALTMSDLKDKKDFWTNLRKAIKYGLSEKEALRALTTAPAKMLGVSDKTGSLKKGLLANFIITNGNIFSDDAVIWENWVKGHQFIVKDANTVDLRGTYDLLVNGNKKELTIEGDLFKLKGSFPKADSVKDVNIHLSGNNVTIAYTRTEDGTTRLSGTVDGKTKKLMGKGQTADGTWFDWNATQTSPYVPKAATKDTTAAVLPTLDDVIYPFSSYGRTKNDSMSYDRFHSVYPSVLIKNATVWTNEADSILLNTDVLLTGTTIAAIGKNLTAPAKAMIIDGTGKYLTPGIIDEHSHIAIAGGVNEGTQASSAEVRIGDVINPEDIQIYRQLAGGVVGAQLLHGSANPIGGQSAIVKLRWGASAEGMKNVNAPGFIKFALGENVKQSNWGDNNTVRFPQTRMGVEQVYYDYFTRAKEYKAQWDAWNKMNPAQKAASTAPRRDLDLEAVQEILDGKRNITCHSYVQSELTMLMHVADSMGFKVNTFTHILEGYKVADIMKQHNVGGSTFADWWAYKYEVKDAIPYNAALMTRMGIVVAVNSDDPEMARRLNQEAAKSMKYGGMSEMEAFKMCTMNPAKLLHLDQHMGSIKVGKDADVVLWNGDPLSIYSKPLTTIVDGIVMYDVNADLKLRESMRKDKARIIQKMLAEKAGGATTQSVKFRKPRIWECDDMISDGNYLELDLDE